MKKRLYSFIYYRLLGWKTNVTVPNYDKCIICAAPHTSNWDLFIGKLFYGAIGRKTSFMMKKEWFFFPLGLIFKAVGGIPVDRNRNTSLVDQMANKFAESKQFHLAITPEGTRKPNPNWKKGFYFIALKAQVPIMLIGIDYPSKTITSTKAIMPTGDFEKDMHEITLFQGLSWKDSRELLNRNDLKKRFPTTVRHNEPTTCQYPANGYCLGK